MLSLGPAIDVISGFPVFRDHEARDRVYVAPRAPEIGLDAAGLPALALTRYIGSGSLEGGFLTLGVELPTPDAVIAEIEELFSGREGRPVRAERVVFDTGQAELILLGQGGAVAAPPSGLDVTVLGSGAASVVTPHTAAFLPVLNNAAAELLEQALDAPALPALVTYTMEITGLRPAFRIKIDADWSQIREEMEGQFKLNVYYVRADVETALRELIQSSAVRISSTVLDSDSAEEAAEAEREAMRWMTDVFFEPATSGTADRQPSIGEQVTEGVLDLVDALVPGASLKFRHVQETDLRRFAAQIDRTVAVRRRLTFQGSLGASLERFRLDAQGAPHPEWPALRDRLVVHANLQGTPRRVVELGVQDRFAEHGLAAVVLEAELTDPATGDVVARTVDAFHDDADRRRWEIPLLGLPRTLMFEPYRYRVSVHFAEAGAFGGHPPVEGDWLEGRTPELVVEPAQAAPYAMRTVRVMVAPGFPFAQFPQVHAELRRRDGDALQQSSVVLSAGTPEAQWRFRGHGEDATTFEFRCTYPRPAALGGAIETDWTLADTPVLPLPDPLPALRRASFFVSLPWERLQFAFLEVRYDDAEGRRTVDERITLSAASPVVEREYAVADMALQRLLFRLSVFAPGLGLVQGDWRETEDSTVVIGPELFEARLIRFRAVGLPLAGHGLASGRIEAEALGGTDAVVAAHAIDLTADGVALTDWSFPAAAKPKRLRVRATFRDADGFFNRLDWQDVTRDLVLLRLPGPTLVS